MAKMQQTPGQKKMTVSDIRSLYHKGQKITAVTAYDHTLAKIVDQSGIDIVLVGDSLGMVVQGHPNTLPVEIEHMIYHTRCVAGAVQCAHLVADMPFMSYQASPDAAIENAGELLKAGAQAVKMEGGEEIADLVEYLAKIGIPVMGHVGLKPQAIHALGGYKVQGKSKPEGDAIVEEAKILEEAGVYALVLESVPVEVAREITQTIKVPTIGIGSGPACSGQILVIYDLLGADPDFKPRFVRRYMNFYESVKNAVCSYIKDVQQGSFPSDSESFHRNLVEVKSVQEN